MDRSRVWLTYEWPNGKSMATAMIPGAGLDAAVDRLSYLIGCAAEPDYSGLWYCETPDV